MDATSEQKFVCPYCSQEISMVLEEGYGSQSYIEDCEVCCNPIEIIYEISEGEVVQLEARRAQ